MKGSKALLKLLEKEGVQCIFGYPGAATIPIYDDLLDSGIRNVLVRHEQCAAHMADGYARATGRPGVCMATSGPGSTNLITGVATAFADSSPMLVLTGQVSTGLLGNAAFQEVDAFSLMMPITKHNFRVLRADEIPEAIGRGMNIAKNGRMGPVHVDLPVDVLRSEVDEARMGESFPVAEPREDLSQLSEALRILISAERPLILAGGGVIWSNASANLTALAEMLLAPVATTLMGKGSIPEEHPLCLGMLGMHGRESARRAMRESDVILAVGTRFSDRTIPTCSEIPSGTRIVQVDIDSIEARRNPRTTAGLVGDAGRVLGLLRKGLGRARPETAWTLRIREMQRICRCEIDIDSEPIKPQKAMHELGKLLADDVIITTEVGQNQMWAAHFLKVKHPRQFITSGGFGTMGFGLPAAIGVKMARPEYKVIDVAGDGSLLMVFQELATAMAEDLPVTIVLINNGWLGMVRQWQKLFWGGRFSGTRLSGNPDFVQLAEAFGAEGVRVERPSELAEAYQRAMTSDVPFIVDVVCDPEEDVLPMTPSGKGSKDMVYGKCNWSYP